MTGRDAALRMEVGVCREEEAAFALSAKGANLWPQYEWKASDDVSYRPFASVYLVKDVLHHWPTMEIKRFMAYASKRCVYMIATQDHGQRFDGEDCELGGYRALSGGNMSPWKEFMPELLASYLHKSVWMLRF